MRNLIGRLLLAAAALLLPLSANALTPEAVFKIAERSVVVVRTPTTQGSGVVVFGNAPGDTFVATNCHVLPSGTATSEVRIEQQGNSAKARLLFRYEVADLCLLLVPKPSLPRLAEARKLPERPTVGTRVYSIGAPRGLELSIGEGVVSQVREDDSSDVILIQTTAPISPGSSGGGLFDEQGRLVGITTLFIKESDRLNFAVSSFSLTWLQLAANTSFVLDMLRDYDANFALPPALASLQFLFLRDRSGERYVARFTELIEKHKSVVDSLVYGTKVDENRLEFFRLDLDILLARASATVEAAVARAPNDRASSGAATEQMRWSKVREGTGSTTYIDRSSIKREGHLIYATTLSDFAQGRTPKGMPEHSRSIVVRDVFDCAAQTSASISLTIFRGPMATGETINNFARNREQWDFRPISARGTPAGDLASLLCTQ